MTSLYIHIPFCIKKCDYCDFVSYPYNKTALEAYLGYLKREIELNSDSKLKIGTVFVGGGTPSLMSGEMVEDLIATLNKHFDMTTCTEITLESNPGTLTKEKLDGYIEAGVNRISIGVQTLNDDTLKTLGRIHEVQTVYDTVKLFNEVGINNYNMDLMFGLPGQTMDQLAGTVSKMIELSPTHISAYSLKFEEGTPFFEKLEDGHIKEIDDELDRNMYHLIVNKLKDAGYLQYEISNFSKKDFECKHNLVYWEKKDYLGLGVAAHSCINQERFENANDIKSYYKLLDNNHKPVVNRMAIEDEDDLFESIMLQLRLNKGLDVQVLNEKYGIDFYNKYATEIKQLKEDDLLEGDSILRLTEKGRDLSNQVFISFLDD